MKQPTKCLLAYVHAVCLIGLVSMATVDLSVAAEPQAGTWSAGAAIGFLGETPDRRICHQFARRLFSESSGFGRPLGTICCDRRFISGRRVWAGEVLVESTWGGQPLQSKSPRGAGLFVCGSAFVRCLLAHPNWRRGRLRAERAAQSDVHLPAQLHRCRYRTSVWRYRDAGADIWRSFLAERSSNTQTLG